MKDDVRYHLLKRKTSKGKTVYYAAFIDESASRPGKAQYRAVRSTKQSTKPSAHREALRMISEGSITTSEVDLESFLLNFWDYDHSEYIKSKRVEGVDVSRAYCDNSRGLVKDYFLPWVNREGIRKLSDLNRLVLTTWRNELYEKGCVKEPQIDPETGETIEPRTISPSTQNKVRQAVFVALQWASDMGIISSHPGAGVRRVKSKTEERKIFDMSELHKLIRAPWSDIRCKAAFMLAASTGARMGECRGLLVKDAHLDEGYIDIVSNFVDGEGLKPPKWGSERVGVPIPELTVEILREVFRIHKWKARPNDFVLFGVNSPDVPLPKHSIDKSLRDAITAAKIPAGRSFHSLRHTYVSYLRGHVPDTALRNIVGHTSIETTNAYTHDTSEHRESIKNAVSLLLNDTE